MPPASSVRRLCVITAIILSSVYCAGASSSRLRTNESKGSDGFGSRTIALVIEHHLHQGSHAIAEALARFPCTFSLREDVDRPRSEGAAFPYEYFIANAGQGLSLKSYVQVTGSTNQHLFDPLLKREQACEKEGKVIVLVALHRWQRDERLDIWKSKARNPYLKVAFLFRTDYMTFAISVSREEEEELGVKHPQSIKQPIDIAVHRLSIPDLREAAESVHRTIGKSIDAAKSIVKSAGFPCGKQVKMPTYEQFLLDPFAFADRLYAFAVRDLWNKSTDGWFPRARDFYDPEESKVKKVHSEDITEFIENALEVQRLFLFADYPTFGQQVKNAGFGCSFEELGL